MLAVALQYHVSFGKGCPDVGDMPVDIYSRSIEVPKGESYLIHRATFLYAIKVEADKQSIRNVLEHKEVPMALLESKQLKKRLFCNISAQTDAYNNLLMQSTNSNIIELEWNGIAVFKSGERINIETNIERNSATLLKLVVSLLKIKYEH